MDYLTFMAKAKNGELVEEAEEEDLMMAMAHGLGAKIIDNRKKNNGK